MPYFIQESSDADIPEPGSAQIPVHGKYYLGSVSNEYPELGILIRAVTD
jgi:hypothetical protein